MLKTPLLSIVLVLLASVLGAAGQFLFQSASRHTAGGALAVLISPRALLGMACYVSIMVLFTHAFKLGGTVRVLYPVYATTFIWAAVMAAVWTDYAIRPLHVAGMVLLVGGIALMSW